MYVIYAYTMPLLLFLSYGNPHGLPGGAGVVCQIRLTKSTRFSLLVNIGSAGFAHAFTAPLAGVPVPASSQDQFNYLSYFSILFYLIIKSY